MVTNQSWKIAGLSSTIEPRLQKFSYAKNIILNIYSKEDKMTAMRVSILIWDNGNNVIWNNDRDAESKLILQAYHHWYDSFKAQDNYVNGIESHNNQTIWKPPNEG